MERSLQEMGVWALFIVAFCFALLFCFSLAFISTRIVT